MSLEELAKTLGIDLVALERLRKLEKEDRLRKQRAGIARAQAQGIRFGRPRLPVQEMETVYRLYTQGQISLELAAEISGVSRSTIHRRIQEYERVKLLSQQAEG